MSRRVCSHQKFSSFRSFSKVLLTGAVVTVLGLFMICPAPAQSATPEQAVELARNGRTAEALKALEELYARDPHNKAVFHDYLTVLSWAGQDERVAELAPLLSPQAGPGYALEAAAKSARRRGDYLQAEYLYRSGLQRFPGDLDFPNGLIMTLADAGRDQAATELACQFEQNYPADPSLLMAKGYAQEAGRDFFAALETYSQIVASDPGHRLAQARRILVLDSLGASPLAVDLAREDPGLLSTEEWQRLLSNQGAFAVRWGDLPPEDDTQRFAQTDLALALLERNLAELDHAQPSARAFELRTRLDRLVALRNRFQMDAVISEYESLQVEAEALPSYVLSAVADAYLYRQQPDQAQALQQLILERQPDDFNAKLALFYTLTELENFDSAYALVDSMDQAQQPWLDHRRSDGSRLSRPNPQKAAAATTAAVARVYGGQYTEAEKRLTALHEVAPANLSITRELANVYAVRGWPRRSQQTYALGLSLSPQNKDLQIGLAQNYLERREYRLAELSINRLYALYPEDRQIRRLQRLSEIHNMGELRLSAGHWDNSGTTQGTREMLFEGMLFSRPLGYHYRMFVSGRYAFAAFPEGDEIYRRYGVGVEYRRPDLEAVAELTYNADGGDEPGGRLSLLWELDDHWSFPANIELFSRDTPLRALKDDVTADSADLGVTYRASELRSISLNAQAMDFSDGNFRRRLAASLEQRLLTLPKYKLTGIVDLYTSANSRNDTIYFNPDHDFSAALTLDNLHRLYRRYDRVFSHRLALVLGNYWQKDFADDYLAGAAYEHIWETAERFELVYGFSRFRRVYDGQPEYQNYFYTRLNWRF
jgi:biofilm PGA synthesis protein PgaA